MNVQPNHRALAEGALANAQRNPVMSAEQSFVSAQVHALLALESRLEEIVVALRDAQSIRTVGPRINHEQRSAATHRLDGQAVVHDDMGSALERAADDGWPDGAMHDHVNRLEVAR
jgi:hypothetical protein